MKLATFRIGGATTWGIIDGDQVIDAGAIPRGSASVRASLSRVAFSNAASRLWTFRPFGDVP